MNNHDALTDSDYDLLLLSLALLSRQTNVELMAAHRTGDRTKQMILRLMRLQIISVRTKLTLRRRRT